MEGKVFLIFYAYSQGQGIEVHSFVKESSHSSYDI